MALLTRTRMARGFTLIELMVVVLIVGLLAALAYPSYRDYVRRSNRAVGQAMLSDAAARQERFFSDNNTYTADMTDLGYAANPAISEGNLYSVSSAAGACGDIASCFTLTAAPVATGPQADDAHCASMTLASTGAKGGTSADCWP